MTLPGGLGGRAVVMDDAGRIDSSGDCDCGWCESCSSMTDLMRSSAKASRSSPGPPGPLCGCDLWLRLLPG